MGRLRRREVSVFLGPPPPLANNPRGADCLILVGGLPWWLSDVDLRGRAERYGSIRSVRILEHRRSGKSAGIALVEYAGPDGPKAAMGKDGLCAKSGWQSVGAAPPRIVLVSGELFRLLRSGLVSWPGGGPCSNDLQSAMSRQFPQSDNARKSNRLGQDDRRREEERRRDRERARDGRDPRLGGGMGMNTEPERPRREE